MKHAKMLLLSASAAALLAVPVTFAQSRKPANAPVVITPPAVPDGSNWSRAPFPAARPDNDVTPPNGEAFDQNVPPNTPSTTPEPFPPPAPTVAVLQPKTPPGEMPTGRATVGASANLAPSVTESAIRNSSFTSRDQLVSSVRTRVQQSQSAVKQIRRTESEMSPQGRDQFESLRGELKDRYDSLKSSLHAAERASAADWDQARSRLAADYQAYVAAASRMDQTVGIAPAQ